MATRKQNPVVHVRRVVPRRNSTSKRVGEVGDVLELRAGTKKYSLAAEQPRLTYCRRHSLRGNGENQPSRRG